MDVGLLREYVALLVEGVGAFDWASFERLSGDEAREYLASNAAELGAGVGRTAYDVGDGTVVKWARNGNGVKANRREAKLSSCAAPGAPVVSVSRVGHGFAWIACTRVEHVTGGELNKAVKATVGLSDNQDLIDAIQAGYEDKRSPDEASKQWPEDWVRLVPLHRRLYQTNEWYRTLFDTVVGCRMNPYELHGDNWGLDEDGDLVLLDAGS